MEMSLFPQIRCEETKSPEIPLIENIDNILENESNIAIRGLNRCFILFQLRKCFVGLPWEE